MFICKVLTISHFHISMVGQLSCTHTRQEASDQFVSILLLFIIGMHLHVAVINVASKGVATDLLWFLTGLGEQPKKRRKPQHSQPLKKLKLRWRSLSKLVARVTKVQIYLNITILFTSGFFGALMLHTVSFNSYQAKGFWKRAAESPVPGTALQMWTHLMCTFYFV